MNVSMANEYINFHVNFRIGGWRRRIRTHILCTRFLSEPPSVIRHTTRFTMNLLQTFCAVRSETWLLIAAGEIFCVVFGAVIALVHSHRNRDHFLRFIIHDTTSITAKCSIFNTSRPRSAAICHPPNLHVKLIENTNALQPDHMHAANGVSEWV